MARLALILALLLGLFPAVSPADAGCVAEHRRPAKGVVVTDLCGADDTVAAVAVEDGGAIVVAGTTRASDKDPGKLAVARYTDEGKLDEHFGDDGVAVTALPDGMDFSAAGVAVTRGSAVVVAGTARGPGGRGAIVVARYTDAGKLDEYFADNGLAITNVSPHSDDSAAGVVLGSGDTVLLAGTTRASKDAPGRMALLKYNIGGKLDENFAVKGVATSAVGADDSAAGLDVLATDSVVVVGTTRAPKNGPGQLALLKYDNRGGLDTNFGGTGKVIDAEHEIPSSGVLMVLQQKIGKVYVAGTSHGSPQAPPQPALARYDAAGALDKDFHGGVIQPTIGDNGEVAAVADQENNGAIVLVGMTRPTEQHPRSVVVMRYTTGGKLDTTGFGASTGKATTTLPDGRDFGAAGLTLLEGGKIIVAGTVRDTAGDTRGDFAVAQYEGDGRPDEDWKPAAG